MARDQITQVRALLSEALKDVVDAPSDVIKLLANDIEIAVSGPVLEFSPVLSDADLVEIIEKGPARGGVAAIARREKVSENLADAIIDSDDIEGIADLLGNTSAQMREEALDELIDRSRDIELWQAPLVARPTLPNGAAERMAGFLASNLLDALRERGDLDHKTLDAVSSIIHGRIGGRGEAMNKAVAAGFDFLKVDPPLGNCDAFIGCRQTNDQCDSQGVARGGPCVRICSDYRPVRCKPACGTEDIYRKKSGRDCGPYW